MALASRVFYGWWVTLAFCLMVFVSTGIRFSAGPFLKPMVADLGIDRASFSLVVALSLLLYGVFQPLVGRLVEGFGARAVLVGGSVLLAAAAAGTGQVTSLGQFALVYGVGLALGLAATGHVVASAVVARWFTRRRATALAALGAASMAGMSLLVPVAMAGILTIGWRMTYAGIGVVVLVVLLPLGLWVIRPSPESMGLVPDGDAAAVGAAANEGTAVGRAMRTVPFWQIAAGMCTCGFSMSLLSAHGVPMLTDHGFHPMTASTALGVLGGTSVVFALGIGALGDRLGRRPVLAWLYGARAVTFAGLFLVRDEPWALFVVVTLGGLSMAGTLAMSSALTADIFGRLSVGSVFGMVFLVHQTGAAAGSWLAGVLFEATGGYGPAFGIACGLLLVAAAVSLLIDEGARHGRPLAPAVAR